MQRGDWIYYNSKLIGKQFKTNVKTGETVFDDFYHNSTHRITYTQKEIDLIKGSKNPEEVHKLKKYFNGEVVG